MPTTTWTQRFLVIACVILGVLLISLAMIKLNPPPEAVFIRGAGAKFAIRGTPAIGEGLDDGKYVLETGVIQLRFAKGADVNIEAPASFRVDSDNRIILNQGTIMAMVPEPAHGFEVATKLGVMRDLGTDFGVTVKHGEEAQVVVFQGKVELSRNGEVYPIVEGAGLLIMPGSHQPLVASEHAYRYPHNLSNSGTVSSPDSLAINHSFEVGPLSRAPHASHRYRDLPSHWTGGAFSNEKWRPRVELPGVVNAGTAVTPFNGSDDLRPSKGERCLFLNGTAVRQRIETPLPGGQYKLKLKVASPGQSTDSLPGAFEVGFHSGKEWIVSEQGSVEPGSEFTEMEYALSIPDDRANPNGPIHLTLSSTSGLIFFDEIRLQPLFGAD